MRENYKELRDFVIENIELDGDMCYENAVLTARDELRNDYSMKRIWRAAPVDVVKLSAQAITSQDKYKLRREDFYSVLVDDALDLLFYEDVTFIHQLKAKWKRANKLCA